MELSTQQDDLPSSNSPTLQLTHPTPDECVKIWTNSWTSWGDSLDLEKYLLESQFLTTIPLAEDGGMTIWILTDKHLPPGQRPILCSCESFTKRALTSDSDGNVEEAVIHGIASVFCQSGYRRRGYAARHMKELAKHLHGWQSHKGKIIGSVLYSDIGKEYYARLGWLPNPTNTHIDFPSSNVSTFSSARLLLERDLPELCKRDEGMVRAAMATPVLGTQKRLTILPDLEHMLWHIRKEDFATEHLFGRIPQAKGAIAGRPGGQVWAIWTHRYYDHPDAKSPDNVLYILRLVAERDDSANKCSSAEEPRMGGHLHDEQIGYLEAVLQAARTEAAEWQLDHVKLWEPSPWVRDAVTQLNLDHSIVERQDESIASGMWYDELGEGPLPTWINNEHYCWC